MSIEALQELLPQLDDALEDLEIWGRHSDQGYRKLKDWYRKMSKAIDNIDHSGKFDKIKEAIANPATDPYLASIHQELST